ncbi:helix-turn-helix domain-containing protein [Mangrovihabitans endophyticus]|uniref:Transcriptional regulator n=1 Tax=Mangrovihabitans endophyticus TaxID=1751298 RepID=A0A8J3BZ93_9ACTN|nr:helix-turn-helix transcriptional regulator [Mangrovihabitans endophyticus]GGK85359.1 transcriptional regulator [Mangrovihabitans endophyticus]
MSTASGIPLDPDEPVGSVLARLRKAAGLTGGQLGHRVGMSQPKISRIENGKGLPDPDDVGILARALGAEEEIVLLLMDRATGSRERMTDWTTGPMGLAGRQNTIGHWENATRSLRVFQPAVVPGLLQSSGYAKAILEDFQLLVFTDLRDRAVAVAEAVSARIRRQEVLNDHDRSFHFVMTEAVLSNRVCPPQEMLAQLLRLREAAAQENVTIGIVAADAPLSTPPFHGFELLDDRLVNVDLFTSGLISQGRTQAHLYRQVFDSLAAAATTEIEPVLDRYEALYLRLAQQERHIITEPGGRASA